ncbi:hypothetical protein ACG74X_19430 [Marivita sp. S0852]|uniref:hypothetical protein n=1 Tax=Marivita sp. S0852 TaxID=3373893 RepID=UPI00398281D7
MIAALGLMTVSPAFAETYLNPDQAWWGQFLNAVDGDQPNYEQIAKKDPSYLAADEFDRDDVLAGLVSELEREHEAINLDTAEVTVTIRAKLGEYSSRDEGFPVNLFMPNMHLPIGVNKLFFRNFEDYRIFPATREEGKALRDRIGTQALAVDVTLTDIRKSTTRPRAYEGFVSKVVYTASDGLVVGEHTATKDAPLSNDVAAQQVADIRQKIIDLAGIPDLGTTWKDAKAEIQKAYPFSASDDFAYTGQGKIIAYQFDAGSVVTDEPHDASRTFDVYLQQVDGAWRTSRGFAMDLNGVDMLSTKGVGPGITCYTSEVLDRCAVLEFSPSNGGHVLTRAYGVIELERSETPRQTFEKFVGENVGVFEGFTSKIDYDAGSVQLGSTPKYIGVRGVPAYAAGAGGHREGPPMYDPLENTSGVNPVDREIALFAVDGSDSRVPLIFVLQ